MNFNIESRDKVDHYQFHEMSINWINGGVTCMDGGAMFGAVPYPVWSKKIPHNDKLQIEQATDAILIQYQGKNILIDSTYGQGKLTEKQERNYGVKAYPQINESLAEVGLDQEDIDSILMTHMHFDHIGGLTVPNENGDIVSRFPNADIYVSQIEWDEVRHPNLRTKSTYFPQDWEAIQDQVITYEGEFEFMPGIKMIHTGGHSNGIAIIVLEQEGEKIYHMSDLMPSHVHQNPLWVTAYDDYPMDSIEAKLSYLPQAYEEGAKFIFYHDVRYRMVQWDKEGKDMIWHLPRSIKNFIPWFDE